MLKFIFLFSFALVTANAADKRILLIAGNPSHGPGDHEHRAGCLLLQKCLNGVPGITSVVHSNGWPKSADAFDGADAIVIYSDGGGGHPAIKQDRLQFLGGLMKKGVGLGCIHYAVELPKDKGGPEFLEWIGGYFETFWSVNPHWDADFEELPNHPITRGVKPFKIRDEWYYHMRFPEGMKNVTPILTAVPPDSSRGKEGVNHPHGSNPHVLARKGMPEHVMWAIERPDSGRGFGITGAHYHKNWGDENFRKLVLNAILWIAKADVPTRGVQSTITADDLAANLDPKPQTTSRPRKNILLLAGKPSHGPGDHEFRAGSLLLKKCLDGVPGISSTVYSNGWPNVDNAFEKAAAVLIYADGGGGHPAIQGERVKIIDDLAKKGVGIGCAHYGVEVPKGDPGEAMHRWIGGHYEHMYSVNPMWAPEFKSVPNHPVTRGVKPFSVLDEWYFNMRWRPDMKGITPILVAKPSDQVRKGPYVYPAGPYPHIVEAAGRDETMMWVFERPDGGRSFGFTGGHRHVNWGNENFRKVVLNALLWAAKADVPAEGVKCEISDDELKANLDPKPKKK